jgi:hypothetical protein
MAGARRGLDSQLPATHRQAFVLRGLGRQRVLWQRRWDAWQAVIRGPQSTNLVKVIHSVCCPAEAPNKGGL